MSPAGASLRLRPDRARRTGLATRGQVCIVLSEHIDYPGDVLFEPACGLGCKGIASKRLGSRYVSGRSRDWIKVKKPNAPPSDARPRRTGPVNTGKDIAAAARSLLQCPPLRRNLRFSMTGPLHVQFDLLRARNLRDARQQRKFVRALHIHRSCSLIRALPFHGIKPTHSRSC
jgi:hypothetical protein